MYCESKVMLPTKIVVLIFSICASIHSARSEDHNLPTNRLVEKYGYPAEVHSVETTDGYILQLHRIPFSRQSGAAKGKPVVLLQHGLFDSSAGWVIAGPNKALGLLLADKNYDVWLGNNRGNTYSRKHVTLHPDKSQRQFWDFSFHEMGVFDIPAEIDYILNLTQQQNLFYIGYSQGTTQFYVSMSEKPEYNAKIRAMFSLAPVAFFSSHKHRATLDMLFGGFEALKYLDVREIMSPSAFSNLFGKICNWFYTCKYVFSLAFRLMGSTYLDKSVIPEIIGHLPAGSSSKVLVHFLQEFLSGKFRKYDFGEEKNWKVYGSITPPDYDLCKITAPVSLYYGSIKDIFVQPKDVQHLYANLPNPIGFFQVAADFNHMDYLVGTNAKFLIYDKIIEQMTKF